MSLGEIRKNLQCFSVTGFSLGERPVFQMAVSLKKVSFGSLTPSQLEGARATALRFHALTLSIRPFLSKDRLIASAIAMMALGGNWPITS